MHKAATSLCSAPSPPLQQQCKRDCKMAQWATVCCGDGDAEFQPSGRLKDSINPTDRCCAQIRSDQIRSVMRLNSGVHTVNLSLLRERRVMEDGDPLVNWVVERLVVTESFTFHCFHANGHKPQYFKPEAQPSSLNLSSNPTPTPTLTPHRPTWYLFLSWGRLSLKVGVSSSASTVNGSGSRCTCGWWWRGWWWWSSSIGAVGVWVVCGWVDDVWVVWSSFGLGVGCGSVACAVVYWFVVALATESAGGGH